MRYSSHAAVAALGATTASAATNSTSLADFCTVANVQAALPANGTLTGIDMIPSAVSASIVYNATDSSIGSSVTTGPFTYCNATVFYTHTGKGDSVFIHYALPAPDAFENRFYLAGGEAFSLSTDAISGLQYGAVGGATSAGYDNFETAYDDVLLYGNGTINWDATYMFGYQALGEMTIIGKALTKAIYGMGETKLYTYFEGCSDGGRQGMSQVQRWGEEYDGAITGAPAFRFAQQQSLHMLPSVVEQTLDYYPPPCELAKIVNATIAACDHLDGKTDGVVSRTDLCMLNFNLSSIIGESYYCAAENSTSLGLGFSKRQAADSTTSYEPAQNGTVSAEGVAVAQAIYDGVFNSDGQRAYLSWQIAAELSDAETAYESTTDSWVLDIPSTGGEYIAKFIELLDIDNLSNIDNVTYDTIVEWMNIGFVKYYDSLQTTLPDLTTFQSSGGKLLHYHGESDPSVPTASSVHYWQSVRSVMYPNMTDDESLAALQDWYQLYLVPGAAHCGVNSLQPDGPFPEDNMHTMINWVENGIKPTGLNATIQGGADEGDIQMLCQWPTRPLWQSNSTAHTCVNDTESIDTWTYTFPAFKVPVY
ncbi:carboxylic ester hydrolase-6 [Coleophoma cylindrospora]|uniref:Carboxylic ester hydrolase n=1 Tax=Coleophoma cylindrospora TaxID=1849047 RepID=A0A3D8QSP8_9HELO|nr:carboxylic ester hydrolase-6 [Coleophoma cylindrospora]